MLFSVIRCIGIPSLAILMFLFEIVVRDCFHNPYKSDLLRVVLTEILEDIPFSIRL